MAYKRSLYFCIALSTLLFYTNYVSAEVSLHDIRAVRDTASIDISWIAESQDNMAVVRVIPNAASGSRTVTNTHIDGETGKIVVTGPQTRAIMYIGKYQTLHAFAARDQAFNKGIYNWQVPGAIHDEYLADNQLQVFNPLVGRQSTLLVSSHVEEGDVQSLWPHVFLLYTNTDKDLIRAVEGYKAKEKHGNLDQNKRWDNLFEEMPNNLFITLALLKRSLSSKHIVDKEVYALAKSDSDPVLAISSFLIANASNIDIDKRVEMLLNLTNDIRIGRRHLILSGIISADPDNAIDCFKVLTDIEDDQIIGNDKITEQLSPIVQARLKALIKGYKVQ